MRLCLILDVGLDGVRLGVIRFKLAAAFSGAGVPNLFYCMLSLDSVGAGLAGQQLIDERLVVALLPGEVLDGDFQLVKRVLHVEQVVEVEREVHGGLLVIDLRVALLFGDCLHSLLG